MCNQWTKQRRGGVREPQQTPPRTLGGLYLSSLVTHASPAP
jgi:hypothetical protein